MHRGIFRRAMYHQSAEGEGRKQKQEESGGGCSFFRVAGKLAGTMKLHETRLAGIEEKGLKRPGSGIDRSKMDYS